MVTLQELREKHQKLIEEKENKGQSFTNDFAKFEPGDNIIRFLPGKSEPLNFYAESAIHKYLNAEGKFVNFSCRKTQNEECPLCDFYFDLWARHKALRLEKGVKSKFGDLATSLKAKARYFAVAVVRKLQEKGENPVKIVAMAPQLFNKVMAAITDPDMVDSDDPDNTTIISLEHGNDFNVIVTKKGDFTNFDESKAKIKKTKAGKPSEIAEWMENQIDLSKFTKIGEFEEGKKIVAQLEATLNTVSQINQPSSGVTSSTDDNNEDKFKQQMRV